MTNNLERRLKEHFSGNSKTTKKYLKSGYGRETISAILKD
jgi:predicted GIY-YIG superfamily endonuclease